MMRFTIALSITSLIFWCDQTQGQSLLQKRFSINGPENTYDDLQFNMDFEVSDYMNDSMIGYALYDGLNCKDGGDNDITVNDGYLSSRVRTDNAPIGDGSGSRTIKVQSEIVPPGIVESGIYRSDKDGNGVVEYCLRFSVYNMDKDDPNAFESNYIEMPIKLVIELNGGFSVNAAVSNVDTVLQEASEDIAVEAYICDNDENVVPIMPRSQGQSVRVCVSPTTKNLAAGALMNQLEDFTFSREIPKLIKQAAISPATGGVPSDRLTVVSCRPGSTVCAFETLLNANFFSGEGTVTGQGKAFLQLGTGNSVAARRLQGTPNQELAAKPTSYSLVINLVPLDSLGREALSSAPTMAVSTSTTFIGTALLTMSLALSAIGLV